MREAGTVKVHVKSTVLPSFLMSFVRSSGTCPATEGEQYEIDDWNTSSSHKDKIEIIVSNSS